MFFGTAPLIFHGGWSPQPGFSPERDAVWVGMKLHHVAFSRYAQPGGYHRKSPEDQHIPPALPLLGVMGPLVEQAPLYRAQVILPLAFDMD
mgnify:FL=1